MAEKVETFCLGFLIPFFFFFNNTIMSSNNTKAFSIKVPALLLCH